MEFKEMLVRCSIPIKNKMNEDDLIKLEENNFSETIINVIAYIIKVLPKKHKLYSNWL